MLYFDMVAGVLGRVKGCPEAEAVIAMRDACIEFCRETYALVTGMEIIAGPAADTAADMTAPVILDVLDARIDGETVYVAYMNDPRIADATEDDRVIVFADQSALLVVPAPTSTITVDIMAVLAPGPASTEAHDVLWQRHSEALKHGALARLLAQPEKLWTNPATSSFHDEKFHLAMSKQRALSGRNRINRAQRLRVTPSDF